MAHVVFLCRHAPVVFWKIRNSQKSDLRNKEDRLLHDEQWKDGIMYTKVINAIMSSWLFFIAHHAIITGASCTGEISPAVLSFWPPEGARKKSQPAGTTWLQSTLRWKGSEKTGIPDPASFQWEMNTTTRRQVKQLNQPNPSMSLLPKAPLPSIRI